MEENSEGNIVSAYYILDFYCPSEKFAIELDGAGHFTETGQANDKLRDSILSSQGIRIIRIENQWIFKIPNMVCDFIIGHFWENLADSPPPSPLERTPPWKGGELM